MEIVCAMENTKEIFERLFSIFSEELFTLSEQGKAVTYFVSSDFVTTPNYTILCPQLEESLDGIISIYPSEMGYSDTPLDFNIKLIEKIIRESDELNEKTMYHFVSISGQTITFII